MKEDSISCLCSIGEAHLKEKAPIIDIKYFSNDNILKTKFYNTNKCLVEKNTFARLKIAMDILWEQGYKIVIWDAFRPVDVQVSMYNFLSDNRFVALPPNKNSMKNPMPSKYNGMELDLSIASKNGKLLPVPSHYEDFSKASWLASHHIDTFEYKHGKLLKNALEKAGFTSQLFCWWRFKNEADPVIPYQDSSVYSNFTK